MLGPPPPRGYSFLQTPAGRRLREAAHQQQIDDGGAFAAAFGHIALDDAIPPPHQVQPSPQQAIPPPEQAPTEQAPLHPPKQAPPPPEQAPLPPPEQAPLPPPEQVERRRRPHRPFQSHRPSQSHRRARRPFPLSLVLPDHRLPRMSEKAHHSPSPEQAQPPREQAQPPPPEQAHQAHPEQAQPLLPEQAQPPPPEQAHKAHPLHEQAHQPHPEHPKPLPPEQAHYPLPQQPLPQQAQLPLPGQQAQLPPPKQDDVDPPLPEDLSESPDEGDNDDNGAKQKKCCPSCWTSPCTSCQCHPF